MAEDRMWRQDMVDAAHVLLAILLANEKIPSYGRDRFA
jgi:hypothetical protein